MRKEMATDNHIFLMDTVADLYTAKHGVSVTDFLDMCKKTDLLKYICLFSYKVDGLPDDEILEEAEAFINEKLSH